MRTLTCLHCEPLPWPLGAQSREAPSSPAPSAVEEAVSDGASSPEIIVEADEPARTPDISVGEALVLARMRDLDLDEALARALLIRTSGGSEADAATALLDPARVSGASVAALLGAARELGDDLETDA